MNAHEPERNPQLAALVDRIEQMIKAELDQYEAREGVRPEYLLLAMHGLDVETIGAALDHNNLFDAMSDLSAEWVEQGLVEFADLDAEPASPRPN
jgi:hypothetical protein